MNNNPKPLFPHQQLTEEIILPLCNDPNGLFGYKNYEGHIIDISPNCIHLFSSYKFRDKKELQNRYEHDVISNHQLVELYQTHDKITHNGTAWSGIEPVYWKDEYMLSFAQKFPVFNKKNDIIGCFFQVHLLPNSSLLSYLNDLKRNQTTYKEQPIHHYSILNKNNDAITLTQREMECLFYSLRGKTAKEIGRILNISQKTVEAHIEHLKNKFTCYSKSELISKAIELGYLDKIPPSILDHVYA